MRRWQLTDYPEAIRDATAEWLLDRLEDLFHPGDDTTPAGPLAEPRPYRARRDRQRLARRPRVEAVAAAHAGTTDHDLPRSPSG
ncbi:MAG: hypothetical protein R3F65_25550 [bacterium]